MTATSRPTAAQLVYGSCTVIFSTLAMLLLSQTSSGLAIAVIALCALVLGLLVALTVPLPKTAPPAVAEPVVTQAVVTERVPVQRATASVGSAEHVREPAGP
ncbi:hypothetical protein ACFVYF_26115 [Streptomyces sp. NPDC058274]|jgi:hypothetical protein|uniref:hypothetical protein n=1 Tax=Streptomyces sp. NPDC058274 TaxID=3346416 RepID=UPI0029CCBD6A|nr:hypothetical protein [Streptomyces sp.]